MAYSAFRSGAAGAQEPHYLTLVCPSCGGRTAFEPGLREFTCGYCGNRHLFQLPGEAAAAVSPAKVERPWVPKPQVMRVEQKNGELTLKWRWFSAKYLMLVPFVLAWDGFLCFWYSIALGFGRQAGPLNWLMILFPIAHVSVGVLLTYTTLAGLLNTTTVKVNRKELVVQHDPILWPGEVKTPITELEQFFCTSKEHKSSDSKTTTFALNVRTRDGQARKLVDNLESPDIGWYLEQQLESYLQIEDHRVGGELAQG